MNALLPHDQALSDLRARVKPARVQSYALAQAVGRIAAENVLVPAPLPARAMALRDGYEMSSQMIAGASSYAPVLLATSPRFVKAGEALSADWQRKIGDTWRQRHARAQELQSQLDRGEQTPEPLPAVSPSIPALAENESAAKTRHRNLSA